MPAILGRRSGLWRCDVSFGRSFLPVAVYVWCVVVVVTCGSCDLKQRKCLYVGWSSSIVDITGAKEMCSVSVSRRKFLRLLVADWRWKCGV